MNLEKYIEKQYKERMIPSISSYEEMIEFGNELKSKGEEYNEGAYNNAKKRLEFISLIKKFIETKKIEKADEFAEEYSDLLNQFLYDDFESDEETIKIESIPKSLKHLISELDKYPEFQKIFEKDDFENDYTCREFVGDQKLFKKIEKLPKKYKELKEEIKHL